jgi:hypothetical protein
MAATTTRGHKTRKTPNRGNGRGLTNYFSSNIADNSLDQLRIQRVIHAYGVSPVLAAVIASLAFGGGA